MEPILAEWAKEIHVPLADNALSGPSTSACVVTKKQGPTTDMEKDNSCSDEDHISVSQKRRRVVVCVSSDSDES